MLRTDVRSGPIRALWTHPPRPAPGFPQPEDADRQAALTDLLQALDRVKADDSPEWRALRQAKERLERSITHPRATDAATPRPAPNDAPPTPR
jgi:hypothetical protein